MGFSDGSRGLKATSRTSMHHTEYQIPSRLQRLLKDSYSTFCLSPINVIRPFSGRLRNTQREGNCFSGQTKDPFFMRANSYCMLHRYGAGVTRAIMDR